LAEKSTDQARRLLMEDIQRQTAETVGWTGIGRISDRVMAALAAVPREDFMAEDKLDLAYVNRAYQIGHGQTISQPLIVALMTELLQPRPTDRVLEIGTGSAYQAAVLARLVERVYSVEVVEALAAPAHRRLVRLGFANVEVRVGDGYAGWPEEAPFDSIIGTAAAPELPESLVKQLKPGGRMVIPIGEPRDSQVLVVATRTGSGGFDVRKTLPVAFVPMVRQSG
jgi:protein-L-isoaspartate(D-aspartate) O-methyltransferase